MSCLCFFYLEKAYDTTWRYGILKDRHDLGIKSRLPLSIQSFLEDRTMQVRIGFTLSDLYDQEQGVPQGSILSTTLFNIKINKLLLVSIIKQIVQCMLMNLDFVIALKICE